MMGERSLGLIGAPNARDLGGLVGVGGRPVRRGVLLRAAALGRLVDADLVTLAGFGLTEVIDLRHPIEIEVAPRDRLPDPAPPVRYIPIFDPEHPVFTYISAVLLGHDPAGYPGLREEGTPAAMTAIYRWFVSDPAARDGFAQAVRRIVAAGGRPVLFHCSAGKDRTGWLAAIVLEALGVDRSVIVADYHATNGYSTRTNQDMVEAMRARGRRADPEVLLPVLQARREYLMAAYQQVDEEFGSVHGYLTDGLGLDDALLAELRGHLLADADADADAEADTDTGGGTRAGNGAGAGPG